MVDDTPGELNLGDLIATLGSIDDDEIDWQNVARTTVLIHQTYRYDSSLAPELQWDGANAAQRDRFAELLAAVHAGLAAEGDGTDAQDARQAARDAALELERMQRPFLEWTGKAERLNFDVPTLPMFVHERLSTQAILETLGAHRRDEQHDMFDFFVDPKRSVQRHRHHNRGGNWCGS